MKPDEAFKFIRPDEVAECWNGILVVPGLYEALWVCPAPPGPKPEEPYPEYGNLAKHWARFSPEHQAALNERAKQEYPTQCEF